MRALTDECVEWDLGRTSKGYGVVKIAGVQTYVHRIRHRKGGVQALRALVAVAAVGLLSGCPSLPVLAPTYDSHGCSQTTEHWCAADNGCCLQGFACGAASTPELPSTCPADECCDVRGLAAHRPIKARHP